jgi:hypothetical protein
MGRIGFTGFARSADPLGSVYYTRRRVNEAFLRAALEDFHKNGAIALDRCAREQPASYLKIFALLMPREIKLEHQNPTDALSDEQLALMVAELEERISARLQGESAKLIDAQAEPEPREQPFGEGRWRKKNPKTPPAQLEKARDRARRLAEVRKAKRAAEGADGEAEHAAKAQAQTSNCTEYTRSLPSSATEIIDEFARPSCRADYRKLYSSQRLGRCAGCAREYQGTSIPQMPLRAYPTSTA